MHLPLILRPGESPRRRGGTMADGDGVGISAGGDGGSGGSSESPGESTSGDGRSAGGEDKGPDIRQLNVWKRVSGDHRMRRFRPWLPVLVLARSFGVMLQAEIQPCLNGSEYGDAYNTSRFGGPLMEVTFISNSSSPNTTFHVLSDNSTVTSLIQSIDANCSHYLSSSSSSSPMPFNVSSANAPQPQQAIQYYRASSVVLTLDGYNNSAIFSNNTNVT
ncbi:hypothetical protein F5141DRAFT_1063000 [Pisolithus sp. B1]|nr:hypothetical protein F5141DRAFT_1063000 [Pisolithus sp. B1]